MIVSAIFESMSFLYMASSAVCTMLRMSCPGSVFVPNPMEMLPRMAMIFLSAKPFLLLRMILPAASSPVFVMMTANSSPPSLETMSFPRQELFSSSAAVLRRSSPAAWPKTSFVSFRPLMSPRMTVMDRFSSVSASFSDFSKKALLCSPVRVS